jgi:hypothetical protein
MARPDRVVRSHLRTRFLITTHQNKTWDAVLMDADERSLLLADTELVNADGTRTKADGQVFLPRSDVAYMQRT